jgi:hypothetical protein
VIDSPRFLTKIFSPTITRYLWEFDLNGIQETLSNIIENNYANKIYIYDIDSVLYTSFFKDKNS